MLGIDLNETVPFEAFGVTWSVGLLPLGKYEELTVSFTEAYQPLYLHSQEAHKDPATGEVTPGAIESCPTCQEISGRSGLKLGPVYREFFRWGIKGWKAPSLAFESEPETYLGQSIPVVKRALVERLARIAKGEVIRTLALEVMKANNLTPEEVLGFK